MEEDGTPPSTNKNSDQGNTHINQKHIQTPNISHITNTQKKTDTEMEIDVIPETQIEQMDDSTFNDSTDNEDQIHLHVKGMDSDYKTDEDDARTIPQRSSLRISGKMNYQDLNNNGTTDSNNNTKGKAAKKNAKTEILCGRSPRL